MFTLITLVYEPFGQSNIDSALEFCPRTARKETNVPLTLPRSGSEWPKDQAKRLMHSRYAKNLYDPKIKRTFEIGQADFEIILFIHINKHLDGARGTL